MSDFLQGDIVFVNFGRLDDFKYIKESYPDINLNESIVIIKYGGIGRSDKVCKWKVLQTIDP